MSDENTGSGSNLQQCYENYVLIDVGANLINKKYSRDLDSVIKRAKDAGVQKIIVPGSSLKSSKEALRLARIYPGTVYCTAGLHPHDAKSWGSDSYADLKDIASNPECVAIGECGLDYNKDFSPVETQREVFEKQIELAKELKKTIFIHEKGAHQDLIAILSKYQGDLPPVLIHSFTGSYEEALQYIKMDMYVGFTGLICKDSSSTGVQAILENKAIPLDRILAETDAPFMYPNARASKLPDRVKKSLTERSLMFLQRYCTFQRNEPCSLPVIVEIIAGFLDKPPEEVALATAFNALNIFGLS